MLETRDDDESELEGVLWPSVKVSSGSGGGSAAAPTAVSIQSASQLKRRWVARVNPPRTLRCSYAVTDQMMRLLAVAAADPSRPPVRFAETLLREDVTVDGHARGGGGGFQLLPLFLTSLVSVSVSPLLSSTL